MITDAQMRRIARRGGKPAGVLKRTALEWLLYGIYHKKSPIRNLMVLKGGTMLSKVLFPKMWRFSEDLDYTAA